MKAFDTDVLTEVLLGNDAFVARAEAIPPDQQAVPILVVEEMIRGRLQVIRQAEAGKAKVKLEQAYHLFEQAFDDLRSVAVLSYTSEADALFQKWRKQKIRVPTHDLRIGAICVSRSATLISRNRRDFERIPGLKVEFWG
jgi:tRNA(fMet)-specific endonuclease VapC